MKIMTNCYCTEPFPFLPKRKELQEENGPAVLCMRFSSMCEGPLLRCLLYLQTVKYDLEQLGVRRHITVKNTHQLAEICHSSLLCIDLVAN